MNADTLFLAERHLMALRDESGINEAAIVARGYRTITDEADLIPLGFSSAQRRVPGLLLGSRYTIHNTPIVFSVILLL